MPNTGLVLILDDEERVRQSLADLLAEHGYETQLWAEPEGLYAAGEPSVPACLILDNHLNDNILGTDVYRELIARGWSLPVIFLTGHWGLDDVKLAMRGGADDFLAKPPEPAELLAAIAKAIAHSRQILLQLSLSAELNALAASLTPRERQVTRLILQGKINKEIAAELNLALVTVKVHRHRLMAKFKAHTAADLARIARDAGIVA
jgi:FixJ family two-component response regulator